MKYLGFIFITMVLLASCASTPERPSPVMTQAQHDAINAESAAIEAQKAAQKANAAVASPSTLHYYCATHPNKGGGEQGTCPDCGLALVHNAAFHNQVPSATPSPAGSINAPSSLPAPSIPTATSPEPAMNADGVYHYTCSNGCEGGAGALADCTTCGNPLAHNAAYHN